MKKWNAIRIENFQNHKETDISLHPGINVILPYDIKRPSDIGKSSIQKAIDLLINNRPLGAKDFFPDNLDKGTTEVKICSDTDIISIQKKIETVDSDYKTKSTIYKVNDESFGSVNKQVPDLVTETLNISDINIQRQHDGQLIFQRDAINNHINNITELSSAVGAIKSISKYTKELNSKIGKSTKEIKEYESEYRSLSNLDAVIFDIEALESIASDIEILEVQILDIVSLKEKYLNIVGNINKYQRIIATINETISDIESIFEQINDNKKFIGMSTRVLTLIDKISKYKSILDSLKSLSDIENILHNININNEIIDLIIEFLDMKDSEKDLLKIKEATSLAAETILKDLKICQFCYSELDDSRISTIMEKL